MFEENKMKVFSLSIFFILAFTFLIKNLIILNNDRNDIITIFHTNDMHGSLDSQYDSNGNLVQIGVDIIKSLKEKTKNSILVDAGDANQGTSLASFSKGYQTMKLMKAAGYDIMTLGNHEFDYGRDVLENNIKDSKLCAICSNVFRSNGEPFLSNEKSNGLNRIIEINNKKIGFFSILTTETGFKTCIDNIKGVNFKNEIESARDQVKFLKDKCDVIVAIMHVGNDGITSTKIVENVPGIDILIDGHSHEEYSKTVGHTFIQQVGSLSHNIGKIEIKFKNNSFSINSKIIRAKDLSKIKPDLKGKEMCDLELKNINKSYSEIIGKLDNSLYGGDYASKNISRLHDGNLGNLMGDALIFEAKKIFKNNFSQEEIDNMTIVSLQNGGGLRCSLRSGPVSMGDVLKTIPFENRVVTKKITPKDLYEILENGVKSLKIKNNILTGQDAAFPNVGGMRMEVDILEQPLTFDESEDKILYIGSRIKKIVLLNPDGSDKKILDRNDNETEIIFVIDDFIAYGGDQYVTLRKFPDFSPCGDFLHNTLSKYIKYLSETCGGVSSYYSNDTRVKILNTNLEKDSFSAEITVKENNELLKNSELKIKIDSDKTLEINTNQDGVFVLENLSAGAHDISIDKNNLHADVYVNNSLGITKADLILKNSESVQNFSHIPEINRFFILLIILPVIWFLVNVYYKEDIIYKVDSRKFGVI